MHAIMYGDRRIADQGGLFPVARFADYRNAVPKILNGEYKGNKVDSYDSLLTQDIHHQVIAKLNEKTNFRASAVARDGRAWTSGIVGGRSSQKEADRDAIQRCQRNVENWGLNTTCQLYSTNPSCRSTFSPRTFISLIESSIILTGKALQPKPTDTIIFMVSK